MHFEKTNFYHHFNTPLKNYSDSEVRFEIEVKGRVKVKRLTDGTKVKISEIERSV